MIRLEIYTGNAIIIEFTRYTYITFNLLILLLLLLYTIVILNIMKTRLVSDVKLNYHFWKRTMAAENGCMPDPGHKWLIRGSSLAAIYWE